MFFNWHIYFIKINYKLFFLSNSIMNSFYIIFIIYILMMYFNFKKITNNTIEKIRFRDQIARFTFIQLAFGFYDYIQGKFDLSNLLNRIMISHIGVASFTFLKQFTDKIKL
uniref:Uncharacterized protein n=1 Tax=viral metagenome TaxID=1070528 RepID=A0A6C0H0D9_9ZZZZ